MSNAFFPNTTQTPDVILDRWLAVLNGSEFKVLMYLVRRTYGFGKRDGDAISLKQMVSGIRRTSDGTPLDWGVGLDKDTVLGALAVLVGLGMVIRTQQRGEKLDYTATHYAINLTAPMLERDEAMRAIKELRATFKKGCREIRPTTLAEESDSPLAEDHLQGLAEKTVQPLAEESDYPLSDSSATQHTGDNIQKDIQHQQTDSVADAAPLPEGSVISEIHEIPTVDDPLRDSLAGQLIALGVTDAVAHDLAKNFPERCQRQLEYLPHRNVKNAGGFLNRAIRENYPAPPGYGQKSAARASAAQIPKPQVPHATAPAIPPDLRQALERAEADPELWAEIREEAHRRLPPPVRDTKSRGSAYQGALKGKIIEVVNERLQNGQL